MNNSRNVSAPNEQNLDFTNNCMYIGFGSAAVITNLLIIIVLALNRNYLVKSAFTVGLSAGDIINGIALLITGVVRIDYAKANISRNLVHPLYCLKGYTTLWLLGIQLPTVMMLLIGVERLTATVFFQWYYNKWSNRMAWLLTAAAYMYCAFSVGSIWIVTIMLPSNTTVSITCTTPSVIGQKYSTYNYGLAIICGLITVVFTLIALIVFLIKKSQLQVRQSNNMKFQQFVKRQWHVTLSMTCIALLDFAVVVLPNVFLLLISYKFRFPPSFQNVGYWSASLVCLRSSLSLIIYLLFNRDFRQKFATALGYKNSTSVQPMLTNLSQNKHQQQRDTPM